MTEEEFMKELDARAKRFSADMFKVKPTGGSASTRRTDLAIGMKVKHKDCPHFGVGKIVELYLDEHDYKVEVIFKGGMAYRAHNRNLEVVK